MRYERVDELEELRRKAALYDEAMKQEPVAQAYMQSMLYGKWRPVVHFHPRLKDFSWLSNKNSSLYARPIPQPDVRELVEALEMIAGKRQCPDYLMGNVDIAAEALAKWETKP